MQHQFRTNTEYRCRSSCCGRGCPCANACAYGGSCSRGEGFTEKISTLSVAPGGGYAQNVLIAQAQTVTAFFRNEGSAPVEVWLQNSPDGISFIDDPQRRTLSSGELESLVPYRFSKYLRVAYSADQVGCLRIWVQMQNGPH